MEYTVKDKRLFLRLGDRVTHLFREEWGDGSVVEERTSIVPGGTCLVRILFEDGTQRTFNNDLDHEQCCYFFGIRRAMSVELEDVLGAVNRTRRGAAPKALPEPEDGPLEEAPRRTGRRRPNGRPRSRTEARAR